MGRVWLRVCVAALLLACSAPDLAVAGAALLAPPPADPFLRAMSPELLPRLERELFVMLPSDAAAPGLAQGLVVFSQPYAQVWRLLTQTDRQREYRTELAELTNLERSGSVVVERHRIRVLFVGLAYHLRYVFDASAWHIEWSLAPNYENDIQQISGVWDLFDLGGDRTLGRLGTSVGIGSAMPRSMQDSITRNKVPETLDHVRRWVDSGGKWRP